MSMELIKYDGYQIEINGEKEGTDPNVSAKYRVESKEGATSVCMGARCL